MKRPCEETTSESDMDETIDVGSENNYSGQSTSSVIRSNSPTTTSQIMARKKRRGIIEKRRRDRINNSLSELRRLVPTAFEKQGSAKLEKAEILQMTVDHLKMLQATGGKGYFDAHALALDFMSIGFRECLTEVARYLSSVEGLDSADPLRVRLVSHLSTCASQREAAALTSSMAPHPPLHPHHWAAAFHHLPAALLQPSGLHASESSPCRLSTTSEVPPAHGSALLTATFAHADSALRMPATGSVAPCVPPLSTSLLSLSATVHAAAAAATAAAHSFPLSFAGAFPVLPPSAAAAAVAAAAAISPPLSVSAAAGAPQTGGGASSKPYRPWGTEVGAF
ncbi:hairy/enhancer-of-split related with YRPW motif protein 2 [Tamandua tetradactyla]|uniref:hairy/enhancer-of-split related with YRPW motif protein 2 n=1 Tax=Tamandua tetradactyla TaxID=48850 RepID=UPI0040544274